MEHTAWVNMLLERVCEVGEEGQAAMEFIRKSRTRIGFKRVRSSVGAFWTIFGNIHLNSIYYNYDTPLDDLRVKTLIIHEVRHLQQGLATALSVYGELDAWQLEFRVYHRLKGKYPHPAIAELMTLPLELDRATLKKAAALMQAYAGKGYRVDLLPLFPIGKEIRYWVLRKP
ncbi:MAG TPA: hypothetical protein VFY26_20815 [Anaerolineales bacterium]|nr:hypothetical protein [Anaerolineales bacterium]